MKLLDRYILGRFLQFFFFALMASVVIFVTVDSTEQLDKFIDAKLPWTTIAYYYYLYIPYIIYLTVPVSVLLGTLFSIGGLVYRNEFTAAQASGYSLWRVLGILMTVALPLSFATLVFGESAVPAANHARNELYRVQVRKSRPSTATRQGRLYMQVGTNEFLRMDSYDPQSRNGEQISLHVFENGRLTRRINADKLHYNGKGWDLENVTIRDFSSIEPVKTHLDSMQRNDLSLTPDDLARVNIEPEEMNYTDLHNLVVRLQSSGVKAGKWVVDLAFKLSQPFATAIIVLFGVPFAAFRRRGGLVLGFGLSLLVCFVYFGFIQVGKILGYNGLLEPVVAAWTGNAVFGMLGFLLIWRVPK
jgi:lipopolysaccharide export system permease protein